MQLAVVRGRATSTVKHASLAGWRLLICHTLNRSGATTGDPVIVLDRLGAGAGDRVIITSDGLGLQEMLGYDNSPARWWTLGIADEASE
ncbi:MAG: ethanolamine utilization protein EutN [Planctomycetes bacterium]|jgi:ethanolamine utilization protein EutN|nr:ethanolamine utilization protein EutN [Planctomycetota bacterium]